MIASGLSGLKGCPATKLLLLQAIATYLLFAFPLKQYQHLCFYTQDVLANGQFKKMLASKLVFLDLPDLIFTVILFYNFRIFERRFGTRKYVSHLVCTTVLACGLELLACAGLNLLHVRLGAMPTGLLSTAFPLFVPFYVSVPRVAVLRVAGVPVTGKTFHYVMGLQLATGGLETMLVAAVAVLAGVVWRCTPPSLQSLVSVPESLGSLVYNCGGRLLDDAASYKPQLPMGATLELQNQERMDRIEQQMMAQVMAASQRAQPRGPGIFGAFRRMGRGQGPNDNLGGAPAQPRAPVSEEQVQTLVAMGFSESQARQALSACNNNPQMATNLLLGGVQ